MMPHGPGAFPALIFLTAAYISKTVGARAGINPCVRHGCISFYHNNICGGREVDDLIGCRNALSIRTSGQIKTSIGRIQGMVLTLYISVSADGIWCRHFSFHHSKDAVHLQERSAQPSYCCLSCSSARRRGPVRRLYSFTSPTRIAFLRWWMMDSVVWDIHGLIATCGVHELNLPRSCIQGRSIVGPHILH